MRLFPAAAVILVLAACDGADAPTGLRTTPAGAGVRVSWELTGLGLPRVPFPNDALTRSDPTSPTGLRVSLPRDTRTVLEDGMRGGLNDLDGFSGSGPILIPFDDVIDLEDLESRQGRTEDLTTAGFSRHAIYLIDLETGLPIPLGIGAPWTPDALVRPDGYLPADPRAGEPSLFLETVREDGVESDFDGVDDVATTSDGSGGEGAALVDRITGAWERQSRTLVLRPLLPLAGGHRHAVVLTERLRGAGGAPIRSPIPFVHPPTQRDALAPLAEHFSAHPELYGDLSNIGFEGVAFMWAFTVQTGANDLFTLADGLEAEGPLSGLAAEFPRDSAAHPMSGGLAGRPCPDPGPMLYRAEGSVFQNALLASATQLGLGDVELDALVASYDALESVVAFTFDAPYLLGDAARPAPHSRFRLDRRRAGESRIGREALVAIAFIPERGVGSATPAAPLLWAHDGRGSKADLLSYAGLLVAHGLAPLVIDAPEHGLGLSDTARTALLNVFGNQCLAPLGEALAAGRSGDFDGDGSLDPGGAAYGPDHFHARDLRRQAALDYITLARIVASFDGSDARATRIDARHLREPLVFDGDYDRDGVIDAAGDWNGDGVPDLGGASAIAGVGMGGHVALLAAAASPHIETVSLISAGGGLAQAFTRSGADPIRSGALFGAMGPVVWTTQSAGPGPSTGCSASDVSLRIAAGYLDTLTDTEVGCLGAGAGPGAVAIVRDLTNGSVGCAAFDPRSEIHIPIEADSGDRWSFELYSAPAPTMNFERCTFDSDTAEPDLVLETFTVRNGPVGVGQCPECARFRRVSYELGSPLVFPSGGLGRRRQSPALSRYEAIMAMALHGADPLDYIASVEPTRVLLTATIGDRVVPTAAAIRLARASGSLPFLPTDAPPHLARWAAATSPTPHDALAASNVIEGASWLARSPVAAGPRFLVDADDLSEGRARFAPDGSDDPTGSRPQNAPTSARNRYLTLVYIDPEGAHGPDPSRLFSPDSPFDASQYLINHVARFAVTRGREIRHLDVPMDHLCLADSSCD